MKVHAEATPAEVEPIPNEIWHGHWVSATTIFDGAKGKQGNWKKLRDSESRQQIGCRMIDHGAIVEEETRNRGNVTKSVRIRESVRRQLK